VLDFGPGSGRLFGVMERQWLLVFALAALRALPNATVRGAITLTATQVLGTQDRLARPQTGPVRGRTSIDNATWPTRAHKLSERTQQYCELKAARRVLTGVPQEVPHCCCPVAGRPVRLRARGSSWARTQRSLVNRLKAGQHPHLGVSGFPDVAGTIAVKIVLETIGGRLAARVPLGVRTALHDSDNAGWKLKALHYKGESEGRAFRAGRGLTRSW